jgi:rSAM/selenodomain-associated transferase 1
MAKASAPGRTKTRLVPPLTYQDAASLNTVFLQDISENILAAAKRTPIAGYMAFGPSGAGGFFRDTLPSQIGQFEAWLPNFGDCLHLAVCELLNRGHCGAIVLNSDSPTLPTALLVEAAELLMRPGERAVLGPANDGGYYLLGLKRAHRRMFDDIEWSTSRVADQTRARAREIGLELHVLRQWYDVDDIGALNVLCQELACGSSFDPALKPYRAVHTAELMSSLLQTISLERGAGTPARDGAANVRKPAHDLAL